MQAECQKVERENRKSSVLGRLKTTQRNMEKAGKIEICRRKAGTTVIEVKSRQEAGGTFYYGGFVYGRK